MSRLKCGSEFRLRGYLAEQEQERFYKDVKDRGNEVYYLTSMASSNLFVHSHLLEELPSVISVCSTSRPSAMGGHFRDIFIEYKKGDKKNMIKEVEEKAAILDKIEPERVPDWWPLVER